MKSQSWLVNSVIGVFLTSSCATDDAAKLREAKPHTIGIFGGAFRPNPSTIVAGDINQLTVTPTNYVSFLKSRERNLIASGLLLDFYGAHHLWDTSAFYVGGGVRVAQGEISFDAKNALTGKLTERVRYMRNDVYLTIPIGWYWIWESAFTLGLDFGPNLRISKSLKISSDGGVNVDGVDRDKYADEITAGNGFEFGGGRGIIGFSF